MSLRKRSAKLEQAQTGDGPDVVTISQTGERVTEGEFRERYRAA